MIYFTADTHAYHTNIIKYCHRPFKDWQEMNDCMVDNINSKVGKNDTLYHLGDWALASRKYQYRNDPIRTFRDRINCRRIHLILGNHDKTIAKNRKVYLDTFESISDFLEMKMGTQKITLCHYALRVWNCSHHGAWHLYGHSHGTLPDNPNSLSFDVGVDCHAFYPLSFYEVEEIMQKKDFKPIDHHKGKK